MTPDPAEAVLDSRQSWVRLAAIVGLATLGGAGMWSVVVVLPYVQAEFGATRAEASLPYTLTMIGFATGGILMGRLADRFGIMVPVLFGTVMLTAGYLLAAMAPTLLAFALAQGVLIGALGSSAAFGPLMADASLWFRRRRGIAVALAASGNYLAGTVWPPILQGLIVAQGWRMAHVLVGIGLLVTMLPLALLLRARAPVLRVAPRVAGALTVSDSAMRSLTGQVKILGRYAIPWDIDRAPLEVCAVQPMVRTRPKPPRTPN